MSISNDRLDDFALTPEQATAMAAIELAAGRSLNWVVEGSNALNIKNGLVLSVTEQGVASAEWVEV